VYRAPVPEAAGRPSRSCSGKPGIAEKNCGCAIGICAPSCRTEIYTDTPRSRRNIHIIFPELQVAHHSNYVFWGYSPNCAEEEFSEVHGSKLPWSGWPLGLWGGAVRPSPILYLQGSPPMWQGIVASDYDLLRPRLPRISRLDALMKACAILAIVAVMTTRILVVMTATRSLERGLFAYPVSRISIQ